MSRSFLVLAVVFSVALGVAGEDARKPKPAEDLPEIKDLPNPFKFTDGSLVRTREDWQRRRDELKNLFQDYECGRLPPKPAKQTIKRGEVVEDVDNKVSIQDLEVKLEQDEKSLTLHIRVAWPRGVKGSVPVVVQSTFGRREATPSGRRYSPFTRRGYGVAECSFNEIAIDNKERARTAGVYKLFGDKIDCGALLAWAWGVSRVIDALETVDRIDAKKVIVTGHSRYGKAAAIAGAFDDRIAVTAPSHSGCGGVAPYRFIYGRSEQLHNIVGAFPYWFKPDFKQFVGKVQRLPIDQHELLALVAPRALLLTEGTEDAWTNPQGAQLTYLAAAKVYEFLKVRDRISVRYRPVGHIPNSGDVLDFADHTFFGKPLPEEFGRLPYPTDRSGFTWDVPK